MTTVFFSPFWHNLSSAPGEQTPFPPLVAALGTRVVYWYVYVFEYFFNRYIKNRFRYQTIVERRWFRLLEKHTFVLNKFTLNSNRTEIHLIFWVCRILFKQNINMNMDWDFRTFKIAYEHVQQKKPVRIFYFFIF